MNVLLQTMFLLVLFMCWYILQYSKHNHSDQDDQDDLVKNYHKIEKYPNRTVLVIESFDSLESLLTLIRNVLNQTIRLDALVLISNDEEIKKIPLVLNTCILNNVGGPSFVFKETCKDTITLHVYPSGFNFFTNPHFLKFFLNSQIQIDGISKHSNDQIDVSVVYKK